MPDYDRFQKQLNFRKNKDIRLPREGGWMSIYLRFVPFCRLGAGVLLGTYLKHLT